ncbi:glucosamine 6-phosphate N-acetyltransferase isoform X1 [Lacerta agilis]|uniref:glucosamine 6-phosphate N-acetyltransferase isoform X1 n=2 Tax=Lacerta agilis TaxID=80427 RepID=UPI00141980C1|nr:glucosamine 6-phosphate N-acetyltransferase isoform X1 [Lacerta agilis]
MRAGRRLAAPPRSRRFARGGAAQKEGERSARARGGTPVAVSAAMMPAATVKTDTTPLYDPHLLRELDWSQNTVTFSPAISPAEPGSGLVLRPLCIADINKGFLKVLGQLTETGIVSPEEFIKTFEHMKSSGDYYITVVEDTILGEIVATATLVIEHKFTHSCAKRGRIEDVVVTEECRGKQLGKLLMSTLTLLSKRLNCYKITLECQPKNVAFYEKFGYSVSEENYMYQRFFN